MQRLTAGAGVFVPNSGCGPAFLRDTQSVATRVIEQMYRAVEKTYLAYTLVKRGLRLRCHRASREFQRRGRCHLS